jgi:alkane 1-monooxygenase
VKTECVASAQPLSSATAGTISARRAWTLHLWSFVLPLINAAFLLTGPHSWWAALLWTVPIWLLVVIDTKSPPDHRQPVPGTPNGPFDAQVYLLTALQVVNHGLLVVMASRIAVWPIDELGTAFANLVAMMVVSGTTAGYSGIVVAHEWIHRRKRHQFLLGRLLLGLVLYEHFSTEHVRGHHPRIGTREDPATARFGEGLREFVRRTIPAQLKSAWRLEKVRLGDASMPWHDARMIRHRVLQGLVAEVALMVVLFSFFGPVAVFFFFMQARAAVALLETVNYIEHWGLVRSGKTVGARDSWDTDNWFTLHTLVGLSRHADHHAQASRPYHQLRCFQETPKMPHGYYGTILLAMFANQCYQKQATAELRRLGLGPFRDSRADGPHDDAAEPSLSASAVPAE